MTLKCLRSEETAHSGCSMSTQPGPARQPTRPLPGRWQYDDQTGEQGNEPRGSTSTIRPRTISRHSSNPPTLPVRSQQCHSPRRSRGIIYGTPYCGSGASAVSTSPRLRRRQRGPFVAVEECPRQCVGALTGTDCFRYPCLAQFWRGFFPLVVRVWTSATGRSTVLVVVSPGRVPLAPSLPV